MTALAYEPFVLAVLPLEWFIERVPSDPKLGERISAWKQLRGQGWDLTLLLAPDSKTVVALGCRGGS